jgi:pantoate--beta-alanine ligase
MTAVHVEHAIGALRERLASLREDRVVGLVPTMGALHDGHTRLIERARSECDVVAVSIFVNPLQFDRADDLARYPRTLDADLVICERHGVDVVFAPGAAEVYPRPPSCTVDVGQLADYLCGPHRPGHFKGVATVVLKLFEIVEPDRAYFGQKDAQQLAIIRAMAKDFNLPIAIVGIPTVREADGLALSSRNRHLSAAEREVAPSLYRALQVARQLIEGGEIDPSTVIATAALEIPPIPEVRLEYLEIVDPQTLQPVSSIAGEILVAGALWVGATRLIDNLVCTPRNHRANSTRSNSTRSNP